MPFSTQCSAAEHGVRTRDVFRSGTQLRHLPRYRPTTVTALVYTSTATTADHRLFALLASSNKAVFGFTTSQAMLRSPYRGICEAGRRINPEIPFPVAGTTFVTTCSSSTGSIPIWSTNLLGSVIRSSHSQTGCGLANNRATSSATWLSWDLTSLHCSRQLRLPRTLSVLSNLLSG